MITRVLFICFFTGLLLSNRLARAQTTTNLVPVADTTMRSTAPDSNFGTDTSLPVGVANFGSPVNRALFQFDLSFLPTNAIINNASLELTATVTPHTASYDLHRMLSSWDESQATWNSRLTGVPWPIPGAQAGTDFATTVSASTILFSGVSAFSSPTLTADVQMWVNHPGTNCGWILMATGEPNATGEQVASREDPVNTPVLMVEYTVADPPVIYGIQQMGNQIRFSFDAEGGFGYAVEFSDSLSGGTWNVLTNVPAQLNAVTTINLTNTISSAQRFYRVRSP